MTTDYDPRYDDPQFASLFREQLDQLLAINALFRLLRQADSEMRDGKEMASLTPDDLHGIATAGEQAVQRAQDQADAITDRAGALLRESR